MTLYEIINSLQAAKGNNEKLAILQQHKSNDLLKEFMRVVNSPAINFYQKKIAKHSQLSADLYDFSESTLSGMLYHLAERNITGRQAERWLGDLFASATDQSKMLIQCVIDKSVGAGVGDKMVLETWPGLYLVPEYMRCSLLDKKTRKHFPDGEVFACQKKADGQYCALYTSGKAYTRQGNAYPSWLAGQLLRGVKYSKANPQVLLGELMVVDRSSEEYLPRQEGNGIINSALKGADPQDFVQYSFYIECWDMLPVEDFEAGLCETPYHLRLKEMTSRIEWEFEQALVIPTYFVKSLEEAFAINAGFLLEGLEGSVIKTLGHHWKGHTSPYNVKLKVAFEIDLEITHVTEGTGKASGMMGSVGVKSREGIIKCDVGTGWSDKQRQEIWDERDSLPGSILAVKANDIIGKRDSNTKSLFLPVALEIRLDKTIADSYDECVAQLDAAKGLK